MNDRIRSALRALSEQTGRLTPAIVLDAAADPQSPLHESFEWDNDVAGERWRLEQARQLIRSFRVVVSRRTVSVTVPAYVSDPSSTGSYIDVRQVMRGSEAEKRALLVQEFGRAAAALRRARDLARALGIAEEIDDIAERVTGLHEVAASHGSSPVM
jgi:hypothetical protein